MMSISRLKWSCSWGRYSWSKPRSSAGFTFCTSDRLDGNAFLAGGGAVLVAHVAFDDGLELFRDALALERHGLAAIHVHRRHRHFAGAGQADADVRVLGFARTVHHAPHHRHAHVLDAGVR